MKQILLISLNIFLFFSGYAQKKDSLKDSIPHKGLSLGLSGGLAQPLADFQANEHIYNGLQGKFQLDYKLSKTLGLGINLSGFQNPMEQLQNTFVSTLALPNELSIEKENWLGLVGTVGPTFQTSSQRLNIALQPYAGFTQLTEPEYRWTVSTPSQDFIAEQRFGESSGFEPIIGSELELSYNFSPCFSFFIGGDYFTTEYISDCGIPYESPTRYPVDENGDGRIDFGEASESDLLTTRHTILNEAYASAGFRFSFGGCRSPKPPVTSNTPVPLTPTEPTETLNCFGLQYQAPLYDELFVFEDENTILFEWSDSNNEDVMSGIVYELIIKILDENSETGYRTIYSGKTEKNSLKVNISQHTPLMNQNWFYQVLRVSGEENICQFDQRQLKINVYKDRKTAEEALPGCKFREPSDKRR